ncbi:para-aminobenzoate synthetase component 1 [Cryptosporangium aurantiacum]|uniref:Para-aminobenzoate synthetase component 1 n=1 Tax=Cryptosporangium aurantiacum TaxID=134849 RepID=A0A1M7RN23_9ACTN|nr:para-aminobenzoate synthetase component 1 [Cryptosporangium aurantiacum]
MGAAVLISAAAGAAMVGAPLGPATPAPEVPDVVLVFHEAVRLDDDAPPDVPRPADGWQVGPWVSSWRPGQHRAAVAAAREAIARGDVYQVNIVGHASAPYLGDPDAALAAVAGLPGAAWAGRIGGAGWAVASGSPECLVTVADGRVVTRPIKGTGPRTEAGRAALLASTKERAEHVMIVDLARNDLGRIATTGSVTVEELFAVRPWSGLWQAESTVTAQLRPGVGIAELLRALCPGASVTGAPKRAAIDVLSALEPVGRGPAMGALGYVSRAAIELGLTIRTVAAVSGGGDGGDAGNAGGRAAGPPGGGDAGNAGGRASGAPGGGDPTDAGTLHLWAGGGITWSSVPDDEVAEAAAKAAPLDAALRGVGQALEPASAGRRYRSS